MSRYSAPTRTNTVVYNPTNFGVVTSSTTTTGTTTSGISQDDADSRYVRLTNSQTITGQKTVTQPFILSGDNTSVSLSSSANGLEINNSVNIPSGSTFKINNQAVTTEPAGSNQQIQYNNNGSFGASNTLTYDSQTDTLFVNNVSSSGTINGEDIVEIADKVETLETQKADITYVDSIIDSAPEQLNTLNELSQALNDDANFGTSVINLINTKQNTLTFDSTPTSSSTNPVTSGGILTALNGKQNTLTTSSNIDVNNITCRGIFDQSQSAITSTNSIPTAIFKGRFLTFLRIWPNVFSPTESANDCVYYDIAGALGNNTQSGLLGRTHKFGNNVWVDGIFQPSSIIQRNGTNTLLRTTINNTTAGQNILTLQQNGTTMASVSEYGELRANKTIINNTDNGANILTLQQNGTDQFTVSDSGVVNTNTVSAGQLTCNNGLFVDGGGMQVNGLAVFVDGATGITKSMVGLGNVDNTADADKPVSTATQTALNTKQNTIGSTTDITVRNISQTAQQAVNALRRTTINHTQFPVNNDAFAVQCDDTTRFAVRDDGTVRINRPSNAIQSNTTLLTVQNNGSDRVTINNDGFLRITNGTNTLTLTPTQITASSTLSLSGATVNSSTSTVVANTTSGTTHYPLYVSSTSGNLQLQAGGGLSYTPSNGGLSSTNITCQDLTVTGNMTGRNGRSVLTSANSHNYVEHFTHFWYGYQNGTRETTINFPTVSNPVIQVTPISAGNWVTAFVKSYTNSSVTVGVADVNAGQIGNNPGVFVTVFGTRQ